MISPTYNIRLDERLETVAGFVRRGSVVADIGTDHGYLVCELIRRGVCPRGFATDINAMPLERARETVARCGLEERVTLLLCDGLSGLEPYCAQDIVAAGMGGELIGGIIDAAAWLRSPEIRLVLQPMSKADELRRWLCRNGFGILRERAALAGRHVYTVISAGYTGEKYEPDELFALTGRLADCPGERERQYIRRQIKMCRDVGEALRAGGYSAEAERRFRIAGEMAALIEK